MKNKREEIALRILCALLNNTHCIPGYHPDLIRDAFRMADEFIAESKNSS